MDSFKMEEGGKTLFKSKHPGPLESPSGVWFSVSDAVSTLTFFLCASFPQHACIPSQQCFDNWRVSYLGFPFPFIEQKKATVMVYCIGRLIQ